MFDLYERVSGGHGGRPGVGGCDGEDSVGGGLEGLCDVFF